MTDIEQKEIDSRRVRMVYISATYIVGMFAASNGNYDTLQVPHFPHLPKGYTIRGVYFDQMRQCFSIKVHHVEFMPVPQWEEIPSINSGPIEHIEAFKRIEQP